MPMSLSSSSTSIFSFPPELIFHAVEGERRKKKGKRKFRQAAEYINININGPTRDGERGKLTLLLNFAVKSSGSRNFYYFCCNSIKELLECVSRLVKHKTP